MQWPDSILQIIGNETYTVDKTGLSGSRVLLFGDKVLKIFNQRREADREYSMLCWLQGKLPVPKVLDYRHQLENSFLLMTKAPGVMSCSPDYLTKQELLAELLAKGLHLLWQVDTRGCPCKAGLDLRLEAAARNVKQGRIDFDIGRHGFSRPSDLLQWLKEHRPDEDLVFSHGDFCLPNIFLSGHTVAGFVDWGAAGAADRYQDIALCCRSFKYNMEGVYGGGKYGDFAPELLFEKLALKPDEEKLRYYILLDELM